MLLLRKFILGKYMPTHSSTKQNAQKTRYSWDGTMTAESSETLANVIAALRMKDALAILCELLAVVKSTDPAIMEHMKQAKMRPKGGSSVTPETLRALTSADDQKNTKRYIMDSNSDEAVVRAKMRLSGVGYVSYFYSALHVTFLLHTSPHILECSECDGKERSSGHVTWRAAIILTLVSFSKFMKSRVRGV